MNAREVRARMYAPDGSYVTDDQLQWMLNENGKLQPSTHHTFDMVHEIRALRLELARERAGRERLREAARYVSDQAPANIGNEPYLVSPGGFYRLREALESPGDRGGEAGEG